MPKLGALLRSRGGTFIRYAAGSVVAFGCSEITLIGAYGLLGTGARTAAILAWVAGAIPNYLLNRRWAWKRRGRAQFLRETLPYWAITLSTAALAVTATALADDGIRRAVPGRGEQSLLLGGVYLAAYGVVFAVKFVLFDKWVFAGRGAKKPGAAQSDAAPTSEPLPAVAAVAASPAAVGSTTTGTSTTGPSATGR